MAEESTKKPFHESVVDFINQADCLATLKDIAALIAITKIPENHRTIAVALNDKLKELGNRDGDLISGVAISLFDEGKALKKLVSCCGMGGN
ncbi:hypothetical protein A3K24_00380 [candidate division Kazan bacterium RIFCSPHIGHO2_01_FULL_44_14]|uniref:Uncharacterized protein n=1 Tax=candidate division Kazan bacterium RIFCSPLOWO2_01_FULL_45_19 TaxID=1798538 RepID=A0A1F4NPE5_UNCK3|nr:MAG: hypothetical protein A3K51_00380 [candidate division Kazan bacterium RIFCSPLOWO2_01_FULL_45_19]OGB77569.1 MAG: hypothetical protein A3K24_00380 [candidate division Kazan bacterium RIFCSPHIGHO2_01_FULL_44_14]